MRKVVTLANRERLELGAPAVDPAHLLLALTRDTNGVAHRILLTRAATGDAVRTTVIGLLTDEPPQPIAPPRAVPE